MSYITRPIRGFKISFLTSVQPNDRLRFANILDFFDYVTDLPAFCHFTSSSPVGKSYLPSQRIFYVDHFFLRSSILRVTISGIYCPPFRFVAFYPVLFLAFLTWYRVSSFQPVLFGDIFTRLQGFSVDVLAFYSVVVVYRAFIFVPFCLVSCMYSFIVLVLSFSSENIRCCVLLPCTFLRPHCTDAVATATEQIRADRPVAQIDTIIRDR